jgi:hypothetical protein
MPGVARRGSAVSANMADIDLFVIFLLLQIYFLSQGAFRRIAIMTP